MEAKRLATDGKVIDIASLHGGRGYHYSKTEEGDNGENK